ncbi:MAG TPA: RDD family protein [Terriglobales bacterium]|nr:RDD family protein [Terriglobales bacterium]
MAVDEVCANCGSSRLADGEFCLFCGDLLTGPRSSASADLSPAKGPTGATGPVVYAGFWRRVWAGSIDMAIEAAGALLLTFVLDVGLRRFGRLFGINPWDSKVFTGVAFILILSVGSWLYCALTESSSWQATIGKRLLGLQVTTANGGRTSFGQATIRHLMKFLSLFCVTIGFMMSGWTKRRQALHDMPCDCLVIRTPKKNFSLLSHS